MRPLQYRTEDLARLLRSHKIATIGELKTALGTDSDATVFRKLAELSYRTSYSHRGSYYTLDEVARFDAMGLWSFRAVYFSRFGTLVATVEALVASAEAGYDAGELEALLQVDPKGALVSLVRSERLARERLSGRYVYLAPVATTRRGQLSARRVWDADPSAMRAGGGLRVVPDELKAAIVLFYSLLDERQRRLYAGLEAMKIGHGGDTQIAELVGIDPGTVARGRRELLSGEVDLARVRRAGGGRPPVPKGPPRSSRRSTA
ncbi:MAG: hypothetical protein ACYCZV_10595 [Acidimicrobiales bacterium]